MGKELLSSLSFFSTVHETGLEGPSLKLILFPSTDQQGAHFVLAVVGAY